MTDLLSKFDPLIQERENLLATGVKDPFSLVMEEVLSPTVAICNGKETILLGTYNYMGMTFRHHLDPCRQGRLYHSRHRQPCLDL